MPMLSLLALLAVIPPEPPKELYDFLSRPDASFSSKEVEGNIEMTSLTWQGIPWKHTIVMRHPTKPIVGDTAILYITGDGPFKGDVSTLAAATLLSGLPVAMLFNIPNQPLWDLREDDLIAHTFERYLQSGDASWPLLFPMTKAAIRAMDAIQKAHPNIKKFVVTGASKRGWTTWLVGAAKDKRVIGIAPMVYDNLNLAAQMRHQMESWGRYSPMIEDYTKRDLQDKIATERGNRLALIVDPYSYRRNVTVPTLIVNGANDPYWTTDALNQYWAGLAQPKWVTTVANGGHELGNGMQAATTIGAFARSLVGTGKLPTKLGWRISRSKGQATAEMVTEGTALDKIVLWTATSQDRRFDDKKWVPAAEMDLGGTTTSQPKITFKVPDTGYLAVFPEFRYTGGERKFSLNLPTAVLDLK
ncbi:MAG TPA: PhoPQ-activated protein PqaA family protein [Fimbriimonas sp.]